MSSTQVQKRKAAETVDESKETFLASKQVWKGKIVNGRRREFYVSKVEEPHAERKRQILAKYPQIAELMGPEPLTKFTVAGTVSLQLLVAFCVQYFLFSLDDNGNNILPAFVRWPITLILAYVVGAVANQSLFLAIHELCHNLGASTTMGNQAIQLMANIAIGVPYAATFTPYHLEHHRYQGHDGIDTDIPTITEGNFFSPLLASYPIHCLLKALFMFIQLLFYALRPLSVRPVVLQKVQRTVFYFVNQIAIVASDIIIVKFIGWHALVYLLISTFLAGSIHPVAGHFLAEHYVFDEEHTDEDHPHETYSYYGFWNYFTYNVGYHREHHDFPNVAWRNLPKITTLAPEFYPMDQGVTHSWTKTVIRFIFDDKVNPFRRVKRQAKYHPDVQQSEQVLRETNA